MLAFLFTKTSSYIFVDICEYRVVHFKSDSFESIFGVLKLNIVKIKINKTKRMANINAQGDGIKIYISDIDNKFGLRGSELFSIGAPSLKS